MLFGLRITQKQLCLRISNLAFWVHNPEEGMRALPRLKKLSSKITKLGVFKNTALSGHHKVFLRFCDMLYLANPGPFLGGGV